MTLFERVLPEWGRRTRSLSSRLFWEARDGGSSVEETHLIVSQVPTCLLESRCFHDPLTALWRYEFGQPFTLNSSKKLAFGTHMWVPVSTLLQALQCARRRLPPEKYHLYLHRLASRETHQSSIAEMAPLLRVELSVPTEFEVSGRGVGDTTIDWLIGPVEGRSLLVEVKYRQVDLIQQMDSLHDLGAGGVAPAPTHDPSKLFRSLESKLIVADPTACLQGVWIVTHLKQEVSELETAFGRLDATKVHFAILGDFERDVHILARHSDHKQYLMDVFGVVESGRFTFRRNLATH